MGREPSRGSPRPPDTLAINAPLATVTRSGDTVYCCLPLCRCGHVLLNLRFCPIASKYCMGGTEVCTLYTAWWEEVYTIPALCGGAQWEVYTVPALCGGTQWEVYTAQEQCKQQLLTCPIDSIPQQLDLIGLQHVYTYSHDFVSTYIQWVYQNFYNTINISHCNTVLNRYSSP